LPENLSPDISVRCTFNPIALQDSTKIIGALHLQNEPQSGDNLYRKNE